MEKKSNYFADSVEISLSLTQLGKQLEKAIIKVLQENNINEYFFLDGVKYITNDENYHACGTCYRVERVDGNVKFYIVWSDEMPIVYETKEDVVKLCNGEDVDEVFIEDLYLEDINNIYLRILEEISSKTN